MRILSELLKPLFRGSRESRAPPSTRPPTIDESIHSVPPGRYPKTLGQPSKVAVVLFYISVICTVLGVMIVVHSAFYVKEEDKPLTFGLGICLVTAGIAAIIITNMLNKREHDRIIGYLEGKCEELHAEKLQRYPDGKPIL